MDENVPCETSHMARQVYAIAAPSGLRILLVDTRFDDEFS